MNLVSLTLLALHLPLALGHHGLASNPLAALWPPVLGASGVTDIWSPADAIYTAAHYLCANGAGSPSKLYTAIWHYNHADWYVQMVLGVAADLRRKYPV